MPNERHKVTIYICVDLGDKRSEIVKRPEDIFLKWKLLNNIPNLLKLCSDDVGLSIAIKQSNVAELWGNKTKTNKKSWIEEVNSHHPLETHNSIVTFFWFPILRNEIIFSICHSFSHWPNQTFSTCNKFW